MSRTDAELIRAGDIATAIALLTRLPVKADFSRGGRASWAYPLAGAALAAVAAIPTGLAMWLGLPTQLAAILWVGAHVILSGAMHEDGLADTADGLWGGWEPVRRLEIMKDSRIGAYGVIALCLSLAARWAAVAVLLGLDNWFGALLAVGLLSRATMPVLMTALPHARDNGLSHAQGTVSRETAGVGVALAIALSILLTGLSGILFAVLAALVTLACARIARAKIGGQTGDILGATQQVCEITLLFALCTLQ